MAGTDEWCRGATSVREERDSRGRGAPVMTVFELEPATTRLAELVAGVPDDLLDGPTPCPDYTLGDLLEHAGGLALAFAAGARKEGGALTSTAPAGDAKRLPRDWRTRIPGDLDAL